MALSRNSQRIDDKFTCNMSYITSSHILHVSRSEFESAGCFLSNTFRMCTSNVGFNLYGQSKVRLEAVPAIKLYI